METRLRRRNRRSLGAIGDGCRTGAGFGKYSSFAATASLWSFFLLSARNRLRADSREALQKAVALVQEGRLEEADQQAQLALSDPQHAPWLIPSWEPSASSRNAFLKASACSRRQSALILACLALSLALAEVYSVQGKPDVGSWRLPPRPRPGSIKCRRTTRSGAFRDREGKLPAVAGIGAACTSGAEAIARWAVPAGGRLSPAPATGTRQPAWQGLDWARRSCPELVHQIRAAARRRRRQSRKPSTFWSESKRLATPSYELAFNLAGLVPAEEDPVRALENYDLALTLNPQSVPALRQAAGIAESSGELERSLSYWIRREKRRTRQSGNSAGFWAGLPEDGSSGRCRTSSDPSSQPAAR